MMDQASPADQMLAARGGSGVGDLNGHPPEVTSQDLGTMGAAGGDQASLEARNAEVSEHGAIAPLSESGRMGAASDINSNGDPIENLLADNSEPTYLHNLVLRTADLGIAQRVRYGKPEDVKELARRINERNPRADFQGQEGIILTEYQERLKTKDGKFQENSEYVRVEKLGEGSFGMVHLIKDNETNEMAVEKCIKLEKFSSNEAVNWCSLDHDCIVRFMGLIIEDCKVMFFMEYNDSYEVKEDWLNRTPMEPERALYFIQKLFKALEYLHKKGIAHNDIHMSNVLIRDDSYPRVKLIDFGESIQTTDGGSDVECTICNVLVGVLGRDYKKFLDEDGSVQNIHRGVGRFLKRAKRNNPSATEVLEEIKHLLQELELLQTVAEMHNSAELHNSAVPPPDDVPPIP